MGENISMGWLSDLMKHFTVSKSFTGAVFVTSAFLLFGSQLLPTVFEPAPDGWRVPLMGALIFCATLLLIWSIPPAWLFFSKHTKDATLYLKARTLSKEEYLMRGLANIADESLDLRSFRYNEMGVSKLEVMSVFKKLSSKGLVEINPFDENLVKLSSSGRVRALQLLKLEDESD